MLSIADLHVHYGGIHALKGVSLEVPANKIITLIGTNGAGKTHPQGRLRLGKASSAGAINFQGQDITRFLPPALYKWGLPYTQGRRFSD